MAPAFVSMENLAYYIEYGVSLDTADWKYIFCLCLQDYHAKCCEVPGIRRRQMQGFGVSWGYL